MKENLGTENAYLAAWNFCKFLHVFRIEGKHTEYNLMFIGPCIILIVE